MCCETSPGDPMQNTGRRLLNSQLELCFRLNIEPWDRHNSSLAAVRQIWQLTAGATSSVSFTPRTQSVQGLCQSSHNRQSVDANRTIKQTSLRSTGASGKSQEQSSMLIIPGLASGGLNFQSRWTGRFPFHTSNMALCGSTTGNSGGNKSDEDSGTEVDSSPETGSLNTPSAVNPPLQTETCVEKSVTGASDDSFTNFRVGTSELDAAQSSSPAESITNLREEIEGLVGVLSKAPGLEDGAMQKEGNTWDGVDSAAVSDASPCTQTIDTADKSACKDSATSSSGDGTDELVNVLGNPEGFLLLTPLENPDPDTLQEDSMVQREDGKKKKPTRRGRRRPIHNSEIKSNTLGPNNRIELPPEKLRVDTRESLLKELELSGSKANGVNGVVNAVAAEDAGTSTSTTGEEHEEEIVNGVPSPVESRKHEPVVLLMIGCQGSGKSKFALDLVQYGAISWARVNQDTLRGKNHKGLRPECVAKARQLLGLGYCVVVDRMNFDHGQREGFIALAKELGLTIHAVVFRLPYQDNIYNVANRTDHEGGFQGNTSSHRNVVRSTRARLFYKGGLPKQRDSDFSSLVQCESNDHYAAAFRQWVNYGRPISGGHILTAELWRRMVHDKRSTGFSKHPINVFRQKGEVTTAVQQSAVGYVPGRDGPLLEDSSEEEAEESEDE